MFLKHIDHKLSAYCHGELTPGEDRRVAGHLLQCPRCRKEYEEIRFGAQLAVQLRPDQSPASLWMELEMMLGQSRPARPDGRQRLENKSLFVPAPFKIAAGFAAILLLVGVFALSYFNRHPQPDNTNKPAWQVTRIEGQPKIAERQLAERGRLALGEWLVTDSSSRAQISVGEIGEVKVEPNSRIRLLEARDDEHRLALWRGKMQAFIWAPPGKFFVNTPTAVAVDMGCSYTLEVNDDGEGLLRVTSGWVAFEWEGRESFVPAEAECATRPGSGPGTPYFNDAAPEFRSSLAKFDLAPRDSAALDVVLAQARKRDALTLWHLLTRVNQSERGRVYDRLASLIAPPPEITREGVIGGDRAMIDKWWDNLGLGDTEWWRMWKGPVRSNTK